MAEHGREVFERFSYLGRGPEGRQDRPYYPTERGDSASGPEPFLGAGHSDLGLETLYADTPRKWSDIWENLPPATVAGGAYGRELAYDGSSTPSPESHSVGAGESLWYSAAVRDTDPAPSLGSGFEVAWERVAAVAGTLGVIAMWHFVKRHKLATALWGLALIAWLVPAPL